MLAFFAGSVLPISITPNKRSFSGNRIFTAWNTFSRIDFYESPPTGARGFTNFGFVFDAGTAFTGMRDLRPDFRTVAAEMKEPLSFDSQVAYLGVKKPSVLIIGSGCGSQVFDAVQYGAGSITAVEINPIINNVISGSLKARWGGLFDQPGIELVTAEGRSYVRRSRKRYDAIISEHTISNSAIASGALASPRTMCTRKTFEDYLDHLSSDGGLLHRRESDRSTFRHRPRGAGYRGIKDLRKHFYAFGGRPNADPGKARFNTFFAGFLLKKTPFTDAEVRAIDAFLGVDDEKGEVARLYTPLDAPAERSINVSSWHPMSMPFTRRNRTKSRRPRTTSRSSINTLAGRTSAGIRSAICSVRERWGAWRSRIVRSRR